MDNSIKLLKGFGINDADYKTSWREDGKKKKCPFAMTWENLIARIYCEQGLRDNPSYRGCTIDSRWAYFMNFKGWMEAQNWKGRQLDKDIITPGNRIYSPENCVFIPGYVNSLFNSHGLRDKHLPLGVTYVNKTPDMVNELKNPFSARIRVFGTLTRLGTYPSSSEAHRAWQVAKIDAIASCIYRYSAEPNTDGRVVHGMNLRIEKLQQDYKEGRITEWL